MLAQLGLFLYDIKVFGLAVMICVYLLNNNKLQAVRYLEIEIVDLNGEQTEEIESRLNEFDKKHISYKISGSAGIGIMQDSILIAGAVGCMTVFKIFYISTVYVDENQRGRGVGRRLMECIEKKAVSLGANIIRLDTFDWQGAEFYKKLGYEQAGHYESKEDGFSEYFFLKRL